MANLRGKTTKGVNLIAMFSKNQKQEHGAYMSVQVQQPMAADIKAGKETPDTNPYLINVRKEGKDGSSYVSHTTFYTNDQIDKMKSAGMSEVDKDGNTFITCKADLVKASTKDGKNIGFAVNTKNDIAASDNKYEPTKVAAYNEKVTKKAKADAAAAREAAKAEKTAEAPTMESEEQFDMN